MKILKIIETRSNFGAPTRKSNIIDRLLLLGCDFTELYSESSSKL
jgi:hypothetical protein